VGRQRGAGLGGGHDEREQTLNQLLVEMDGFESNEGVILIAATNRPDVLDPALLRPGRFDRQVVVPTPDLRGRKRILEVHTKRTPLDADVDLDVLARGTPGFSGADLENLVNEAALQAAKLNQDALDMRDFEYAKDKVLMGRERRSLILSEEEKRITAYHEAGHALAAKLLPGSDPVHKVTIIPRGRALGITMQLPEEDRHGYSRTYLLNNLVVLLGGRVAEELIFDDITTGASNDIERVTRMTRKMVCEWGMSDAIGTLAIGETGEEVFIGREWIQNKNYSEDTARLVDAEVKRIIDNAHSRCRELLQSNGDILRRIADALLERETVSGEELEKLINNEELPPLETNGHKPPQGGSADAAGKAPEKPSGPEGSGGNKSGPSRAREDAGSSAPGAEKKQDFLLEPDREDKNSPHAAENKDN
jgi:cell division protease FtsH